MKLSDRSYMPIITLVFLLLLSVALAVSARAETKESRKNFDLAVDEKGKIHLPTVNFQRDWTALGTWAIAAEEGTQGSEGFHIVYTQPGSVSAFLKTGTFPDGTIIIKELYEATSQEMTTGTVSHATITTGWFVMIKDTKNRYPHNTSWGNGWGWAHFDVDDKKNSTSVDYRDACLSCHEPAKNTDWLYLQGYPILTRK
ncbi:cytochrome P460 family protein [Sneathiella aquimaris]|uniref:cytochrome P460 family protein n=1 Tax=Sneathiella aquimaris TaxID=2599305 RepID=UPI00146DF1E9|nr:cytochrome P460 family protein [Sneathiella aquimaris]